MSLDLAKFDVTKLSEKGFEFQLTVPEVGTKLPAWITIRGEKSKPSVAFQKKYHNALQQKNASVMRKTGKAAPDPTIDEVEELLCDTAVVRTISWRGIAENGVEIPFTVENAQRIYAANQWIRDQIISESNLLTNFLDGNEGTS